MAEKRLKFNNIKVNKKGFHRSKQAIDLDLVDTGKIVVSDRFKHSQEEIVKPLCIILPHMKGYIKYFDNGGKKIYFLIKNSEVWEKYEETWDVIKNKLNIKFHS